MAECVYNYDDVLDAFTRGDYAYVLRIALPAAMAGNSGAQSTISLLYQCGYGLPQDLIEAERWLLRATEQDDAVAWNNLGTLYMLGWPGLPRNKEKALECYLKAKELGFDCAHPYPPPTE
jgi:TPR repeat protein